MFRTLHRQQFHLHGEMGERIEASLNRLEADDFHPDKVYRSPDYDWPGDQEGRTMLALIMLAQVTGREPLYLQALVDRIEGALNERGYFGKALPLGEFDEQQLSGNSWFLRSLCELYEWKREDSVLRRIENLASGLILPTRGAYRHYPTLPEQREFAGEAAGTLQAGLVDGWRLSTDIGCAFIMLDGATHAYRLLGWPELAEVIDEMADTFLRIDVLQVSMQTHATLSGVRGLMRYAEDRNDASRLEQARQLFELYKKEGMTENYANCNWFGRPEWTEPCAVIDSFLIATELWRLTANASYLDAAHEIYYNAISHGQRPNGGFGCDCCAGAREPFLYPLPALFEAWWCCTMRGGDGLARAASFALMREGDELIVPFYHPGSARIAGAKRGKAAAGRAFEAEVAARIDLEIETGYPLEGSLRIRVRGDADGLRWRVFIPSWVVRSELTLTVDGAARESFEIAGGFLSVDGMKQSIEIAYPIVAREEPVFGNNALPGGYRSFRYGPSVLGVRGAEDEEIKLASEYSILPGGTAGEFRLRNGNGSGSIEYALKPFNGLFRLTMEDAAQARNQILFAAAETVDHKIATREEFDNHAE